MLALPAPARSQPQGRPEIDWSNPLTAGLIGAFLPGVPVNLADGVPMSAVSSYALGVGAAGRTIASGGLGYPPPPDSSSPFAKFDANVGTALVMAVQSTETNSGTAMLRGNGSSSPVWSVGLHGGSFDGAYGTWGSFSYTPPASGEVLRPRVVAISADGSFARLYLDGVQVSSGGFTPISAQYDTANYRRLLFGNLNGQLASTNTRPFVGFFWNRTLSAEEVARVSRNVWALFRDRALPLVGSAGARSSMAFVGGDQSYWPQGNPRPSLFAKQKFRHLLTTVPGGVAARDAFGGALAVTGGDPSFYPAAATAFGPGTQQSGAVGGLTHEFDYDLSLADRATVLQVVTHPVGGGYLGGNYKGNSDYGDCLRIRYLQSAGSNTPAYEARASLSDASTVSVTEGGTFDWSSYSQGDTILAAATYSAGRVTLMVYNLSAGALIGVRSGGAGGSQTLSPASSWVRYAGTGIGTETSEAVTHLVAAGTELLTTAEFRSIAENVFRLFDKDRRLPLMRFTPITPIELAGTASVAVTASAALTTAKPLASSVSIAVTRSAALTTSKPLAATASTAVTATAALTTSVALAASANIAVTATAAMAADTSLAASATTTLTASAALTTAIQCAASAQVVVTATATLTDPAALSAQAQLAVTATGSLTTGIALAGTAAATVTATASLSAGTTDLGASCSLVVTATGSLTTAVSLAAAASTTVTASAQLTTEVRLAADAVFAANAVASLLTQIRLATSAGMAVTATAALTTEFVAPVSPIDVYVPAHATTISVPPHAATMSVAGSAAVVVPAG